MNAERFVSVVATRRYLFVIPTDSFPSGPRSDRRRYETLSQICGGFWCARAHRCARARGHHCVYVVGSLARIGPPADRVPFYWRQMKTFPALATLSVCAIVGRERGQLATPVDGRYGPMDPDELRPAIERLAREVDLEGAQYALGIPEGGYIPAYAFAVETGLRVALASVFQPSEPGVVSFIEEHDRPPISGKHVFGLSSGDHVIVVEDEVTSGQTIINCVRALRAAGIRCDQVATIYAVDDPAMRARVAAEGIRLHAASLCQADTSPMTRRATAT